MLLAGGVLFSPGGVWANHPVLLEQRGCAARLSSERWRRGRAAAHRTSYILAAAAGLLNRAGVSFGRLAGAPARLSNLDALGVAAVLAGLMFVSSSSGKELLMGETEQF
jgi:hypothetical protein